MKRFSISRRNSVAKMILYMPKFVTRPKTKRVQRGHYFLLVTVWWGGLYSSKTWIHFCNAGVKTNGEVYQVMFNVLPPLEEIVFVYKDE